MIAAKTPQGHREVAVRSPLSYRKGLYIEPASLVIHYTFSRFYNATKNNKKAKRSMIEKQYLCQL